MSGVGDALRALAAVISERGNPWYVVGAQAVMVRGVARTTQDIDVTVEMQPEERQTVLNEAADGAGRRRPDGPAASFNASFCGRADVEPGVDARRKTPIVEQSR